MRGRDAGVRGRDAGVRGRDAGVGGRDGGVEEVYGLSPDLLVVAFLFFVLFFRGLSSASELRPHAGGWKSVSGANRRDKRRGSSAVKKKNNRKKNDYDDIYILEAQ